MGDHPIGDMMASAMEKIRSMVDSNTVVGEPISTPDGVTLIPISRVSFGFASGGNDNKSSNGKSGMWGGSGAAVKVEPLGFLSIHEGTVRMLTIQPPAFSTADRIIDMVPEVLEKIESYVEKYGKKAETDKEK